MQPLFHLGYPKCGSTFLQARLFHAHPALKIISPHAPLGIQTETSGSPEVEAFTTALSGPAKQAAPLSEFNVETLFPKDGRRGVFTEENALTKGVEPAVVISRLASYFPDARVLFILRDQVDLLRSYYDMYPTIGAPPRDRYAPFSEWIDWVIGGGHYLGARLKYDTAVRSAISIFGRDQVFAVDFDALFKRHERLGDFCAFVGVEQGFVEAAFGQPAANDFTAYSARKLARRILGPVRASWFLPYSVIWKLQLRLGKLIPAERTVARQEDIEAITAHFRESNHALFDLDPPGFHPATWKSSRHSR